MPKPRQARKVQKRASSSRPARKTPRRAPARTKAAPAAKSARSKQRFVASHLTPDAFAQGLRSYAKYRDLDIAAATNGLIQAHVIKMVPPCNPAEGAFSRCRIPDDLRAQRLDQRRLRRPGRRHDARGVRAGCSRPGSSIKCSTIPMTANSSKSSCRRISKP